MGTLGRPDFDSAHGWRASCESRANRWAWYVASGVLILLTAPIVTALIYRLSARLRSDLEDRFSIAGHLPAGFDTDRSPEANAFRATCAQCHALPSPSLYDEAGWRLVSRKMGGHIAAQGMTIPARQIELATEYLIRHARRTEPVRKRPPAAGAARR
jgi:hypothetical protein